jgi:hypothetical protein
MNFRLVDSGWDKVLGDALRADSSSVRIVCPFIKRRAAERLLIRGKPKTLQVITRFNLGDFSEGVSDTSALRLLLDSGAQIRGVRNLHAKLYLCGRGRAIVTSANLTDAALRRNHEFGFVADDVGIVGGCHQYFDDLWRRAGKDLSAARLTEWEHKLAKHRVSRGRSAGASGLGDEGVDAEVFAGGIVFPGWDADTGQAFVKFFGVSSKRADRSRPILEAVQSSGCHWACTYPKGKRPRQVQDGAVMFIGSLAKEPNDILIYGRGVGMRHVPRRDDATDEDIGLRSWKAHWPHYVRVHDAEFIAGSLANGVSLNELMDVLKSDAFVSTQRHAAKGKGNTDPRKAYMQQAAVELSTQGIAWLNKRLERAFAQHGKLASADLEQLDWPVIPSPARKGAG